MMTINVMIIRQICKTAIAHSSIAVPRLVSRLIHSSVNSLLLLGMISAPLLAQNAPADESDSRPPSTTSITTDSTRPILRLGNEGEAVAQVQALLKLLGYYTGAVDGLYREDTAAAVSTFQEIAGLDADGIVGPATWTQLLPPVPLASPNQTAINAAAPQPEVTTFAESETTPASGETTSAAPPAVSADPTLRPDSASEASDTSAADTSAADTSADTSPTDTTQPPSETDATAAASPPTATVEDEDTAEDTTVAAASESPEPVALPILRIGMYGPAVTQLQERLQVLGVYQGAIDGIFGPATQEAVQAAQRQNQLNPDGIVGPATWRVLLID